MLFFPESKITKWATAKNFCLFKAPQYIQTTDIPNLSLYDGQKKKRYSKLPFPVPVNTNTIGEIPDGSPNVAISSPMAMTAALAAASEGYICDCPRERNGVEYPRLKYPEI